MCFVLFIALDSTLSRKAALETVSMTLGFFRRQIRTLWFTFKNPGYRCSVSKNVDAPACILLFCLLKFVNKHKLTICPHFHFSSQFEQDYLVIRLDSLLANDLCLNKLFLFMTQAKVNVFVDGKGH